MAKTSQGVPRAARLVGAVAVLGLLTSCGGGDGTSSAPQKVTGTAAPATEGGTTASAASAAPSGPTPTPTPAPSASASSPAAEDSPTAVSARCHTSELRASVGRNDPGAGQWNFPVVLTNTSGRTCTVRGYPGAAFLDASGKQLGPDPRRSAGTPVTVTLAPGRSAWAGLTFSNPEVSGARAATPQSLLVTPPDERDPLKVAWTAGQVPVSGNASSVFLTVFAAGSGP
ncbi:hypothetical protein ADK57_26840 [Streptomyces sp. MMG1533]|uniref:DUF4232 domain-containing protein n=1 Tax=Streptomyces sp. MMG1533 TaxID=1415546 RepID=UPI0006B04B1C|nr:DUF4232 domain-containing protein [Streptomyces sp. MMG1533]KOU61786.1 hypothetical protein ADK57_26840 [Streptomyces sp. MMG1533]